MPQFKNGWSITLEAFNEKNNNRFFISNPRSRI